MVVWMQFEIDLGYDVQVEFNCGKGWCLICDQLEEQVNLKGFGVFEDLRVVVQQDGVVIDCVNWFVVIC